MSIKYNNEIIAGKYKSQIISQADTVNSGIIKIATQEEVDAGENNTTAITPQYLSTKQDKLIAGDNILLDENLIECTLYPDDITIVQNEDGTLTNIAQKTANDVIKIDWTGTTAEYEQGMLDGTIQPDWYCYITDDEQIIDLNKLNDSNLNNVITNCLLEVPQRINLELTDGTLTLKAGSVVIVPYGTNDLTNQHPIGSNFLNEYWEVQATQYVNKKFFVWAELQKDISRNRTDIDGKDRYISVYLDGTINGVIGSQSGTTFNNALGYNTSENIVYWYDTSGVAQGAQAAFPVGIIACNDTYVFGSIKQIFNGMGYIGNVVWTDKDIKVLIPHGKTNNGSLDNIKLTSEFIQFQSYNTGVYEDDARLVFYNNGGTGWFRGKGVFCQENKPSFAGVMTRWYNPSENQWYEVGNATSEFYKIYATMIASYKITNGVISNFKIDNTFRAVSYNEFKQKADKSEVLKINQVTNCLTEVPQTVKLDLTNDVLTIKAGTIITVPYGTMDLSSTYSVGSQFMNSNFKVVDTHYSNNQFFVRAELQSDITRTFTGTGNYGLYIGFLNSNNSLIITFVQKSYSGTVDPATTYCSWYNTSENKVRGYTTSYDRILSFPLGKITISAGTVTSIDQVFNGFGYIGSTFWVDKGVKGLMPNGRNSDGSFNNTELTLSTIKISNFLSNFTCAQAPFCINNNGAFYWGPNTFYGGERPSNPVNYSRWYNVEENWWYEYVNGWYKKPVIVCGYANVVNGVIKEFNPYTTFRAVDYNEFSNLRETVDTLNDTVDTKVSKTGDTMTDNLRIEKNSGGVQVQGTGFKGIYTYSTDIDYTAVNQTNLQASVMSSYDKNNKCFAFNQHFIDNAGRVRNELRASRVINGTAYQAYLAFCVSTTGVPEIFINGHTLRAYLISTYTSGTSGYNIWSNGYCEQWGRTGTGQGLKTVTLLKTFANTNYSALTTGTYDGNATDSGWDYVRNITTTSFDIYQQSGGCMWKACGYLASGQY